MKNLQISSFKKKIAQFALFIVALCVVSVIAYATTELFAAEGPSSAEIKKYPSQIVKVASKAEAVVVEEETLENTTAESEAEKGKGLISHELTHVNQSKAAQDDKHKEWIEVLSLSNETTDAETKNKRPPNRPEYTDINTHDPGIADEKHEKWIDVLSISNSETKESSFGVEREMKESGEKGGTTDMNIGLGELQETAAANKMDKITLRKRPGRTTYRGTKDSLKLSQAPIGYVCEGSGANDECFCDGVLDCNKLWKSDDCKTDTEWQDGKDSSKGGCTAAD